MVANAGSSANTRSGSGKSIGSNNRSIQDNNLTRLDAQVAVAVAGRIVLSSE